MATIPAARLKDIPALARDNSNLSAVMDAIREAMQTFRGYRGDPLDQALTLRDALDKGVLLNSALNGYGRGPLVGPGSPDWPITSLEADLTPPPTPTGLTASAGITYIYINCDVPVYTQGHGHDRTVVYGAKWPTGDAAPTFSSAVELFTFQGTVGAYPTEPATRWCIWIKWKSNDGVLSVSPAGGTNGINTTTGQDVSRLLTALTGQITAGQLYTALGARINLIDTPTTGLVDQMTAANSAISTKASVSYVDTAKADAISASATASQTLVSSIRVGGRNLYTNVTPISDMATGVGSFTRNISGFSMNGITSNTGIARMSSIIPKNGEFTIGFDLVVSAAAGYPLTLDFCDTDPWTINPTTSIQHFSHTFTITNYSPSPYTFIDFNDLSSQTYTFTNFQVEEGNIATSWTPAPEDFTAALQVESTTRASQTGDLFAQYTVKLDVGGKVSGYGLASTSTASEFAIRADRFYIAPPAGTSGISDIIPFIVQTSPTTINGIVIPAGVYMDAAYIVNLTAMLARLGSAWIDNAMIANLSAAKLTAGDGTIGGNLKSSNYVSGSAGWLLQPNGNCEFGAGYIRGQLLASQIDARGLSIRKADGTLVLDAGDTIQNQIAPYASGATVGATWGSNISGQPANLAAFDSTAASALANKLTNGASNVMATSFMLQTNGYAGGYGVALYDGGLIAKYGGATTFVIDSNGSATFSGVLSAATGTFAGSLSAATGSFAGSLTAATGTLGALTIAYGGYIQNGQTGYNTGVGFWFGSSAGTPKFSIGNPSGPRMLWDGTDLNINTPTFDTFSATIPSGNLTASLNYGLNVTVGSRSVSVTGGKTPYSYVWDTISTSATHYSYRNLDVSSGVISSTATVSANGDNSSTYGVLRCIVTDANGRTTSATVSVSASFSSSGGGGV